MEEIIYNKNKHNRKEELKKELFRLLEIEIAHDFSHLQLSLEERDHRKTKEIVKMAKRLFYPLQKTSAVLLCNQISECTNGKIMLSLCHALIAQTKNIMK